MTDSVAVFPPGFRLEDETGVPYAGAVIRFYDAGTTTPKTVYADADLSTALGTSVTCDTAGYPTSNGTTKTLIYTGTASYKVTGETSAAASIFSHDNVKGAVESAAAGGAATAEYETTVETKSLDYTIVDADQSKIFLANCSSANVTFTLPSAVDVGAGWRCRIDHAGSANEVTLETVSSQTIRRGGTTYDNSFSFAYQGEGATLVSDGGNWVLTEYSPPFMSPSFGVVTVAGRLSTPPGSPADGAVYLLTSSPTGAWSTFAEHDLAQWTGADWVKFTPLSDSGWLAYVQDEDIYYRFVGSAWVAESASTSTAGTVRLADAAAMEAGTASRAVTADIAHRAPSAAKAWAYVTTSGGTPTLQASQNVASITDTGTGILTVTFTTAFSSTNYATLATLNSVGSQEITAVISSKSTTALTVTVQNAAETWVDPDAYSIVCFGDQ